MLLFFLSIISYSKKYASKEKRSRIEENQLDAGNVWQIWNDNTSTDEMKA